jgi:arylsulfatase A
MSKFDNDYFRNANITMSGKIYSMLKQKGLINNTIIIFTSDNGPQDDLNGPSVGPFFATYQVVNERSNAVGKGTTWEGGMRVPGFIVWEGREDIIKPNTISKQIYSSMDIVPTILNILGIESPQNLDGTNMILNMYSKDLSNRFLYYYRGGCLYAVR